MTFISKENPKIKFAVDLKTTYRDEEYPGFCNGFTLGSYGEYFTDRTSTKNIQYPYDEYSGHFCFGIIYSRNDLDKQEELKKYSMLSTWEHTKYRENEYLKKVWGFCNKKTKEHFYHIGAKETNRNSVTEALLMNYTPFADSNKVAKENEQLSLF